MSFLQFKCTKLFLAAVNCKKNVYAHTTMVCTVCSFRVCKCQYCTSTYAKLLFMKFSILKINFVFFFNLFLVLNAIGNCSQRTFIPHAHWTSVGINAHHIYIHMYEYVRVIYISTYQKYLWIIKIMSTLRKICLIFYVSI